MLRHNADGCCPSTGSRVVIFMCVMCRWRKQGNLLAVRHKKSLKLLDSIFTVEVEGIFDFLFCSSLVDTDIANVA